MEREVIHLEAHRRLPKKSLPLALLVPRLIGSVGAGASLNQVLPG